MTYPASGSGTVVNNYGPGTPNGATQGQAPPFGAPGAAANVSDGPYPTNDTAQFNFAHGITSTQEMIVNTGPNLVQQGQSWITNAAQITLSWAGINPASIAVFTGKP